MLFYCFWILFVCMCMCVCVFTCIHVKMGEQPALRNLSFLSNTWVLKIQFRSPGLSISLAPTAFLKIPFLTDFITSLLPEMASSLWIGLRWTAYDRINKWTDGRDLTYSNFHPLLVGRRLSIPASVSDVSVICGLLGTLASPVND